MDKPIIYFICTGNACRSQMAEGFGKVILGDNWTVMSGGIEAHGVNPHAVKAMQEVNIDISDQTSDKIDIDLLNKAKLVVTLCDHAEAHCPV
ncbi:MAG: arsenate reductase, partial [Staphylococcus simulans]|nr:arsenate reductase [Staphylococcus simulans]